MTPLCPPEVPWAVCEMYNAPPVSPTARARQVAATPGVRTRVWPVARLVWPPTSASGSVGKQRADVAAEGGVAVERPAHVVDLQVVGHRQCNQIHQ